MKPTRHLPKTIIAAALLTLSSLVAARAQIPTLILSNKWSLATNSHFDLGTGNLDRGIAINKTTGNVLLASRTSSNHISVISGFDGSDLGVLTNGGFEPVGTLQLDLVRVTDDGVIYAANLAAATSTLKIYRYESEASGYSNAAVVAYALTNVTTRFGDAMDIRGTGASTQILLAGSGGNAFMILTADDTTGTNWTRHDFPFTQTGLAAGDLGKGITFDGANDALYGKKDGSATLRKIGFNLTANTSTLITNITLPDTASVGTKFASSNGVNFVAAVVTSSGTSPHRLKAYTLNSSPPTVSGDFGFPTPSTGNGNVIGATDVGNGMVVGLDPNNGIVALTISFQTNVAPSIITQPQDQTNVLQGGYVSFSVSASGTAPLRYQWRLNDAPLGTATNATLNLTNLDFTNQGLYTVVITNNTGSITSSPAQLTIVPATLSSAFSPTWSKSVGDLFFLSNDNTARGLAFNPATGHLVVVSRFPSNGVHIVDAATGTYLHSLDMSGVTLLPPDVTFAINVIGVADDGAIYVCNLGDVSVAPGNRFQIYRWADENASTVATIAFPDSNIGVGRIGDTFAVRGAGANTQLIAGSRNLTFIVLFTTTDGQNFSANVIDTAPEPDGLAGLGIAFGAGNTFWTKNSGFQYRHIAFDLVNGTNGLLQTFATGQATATSFSVDPVNDLVAGIVPNTGTRPIPDQVELLDVYGVLENGAAEPAVIDHDFFKSANANGNGVGAAAFDVPGGRLFALDTNNGLLAGKVVARLLATFANGQAVLTWTGPSVLQTATTVTGPFINVSGATSPYTNAISGTAFFRLKR